MNEPQRHLTENRILKYLLAGLITDLTGDQPEEIVAEVLAMSSDDVHPDDVRRLEELAQHMLDERETLWHVRLGFVVGSCGTDPTAETLLQLVQDRIDAAGGLQVDDLDGWEELVDEADSGLKSADEGADTGR